MHRIRELFRAGMSGEPAVPSWSYTIGFGERGLPEIITFGLHPTDAIALSNLARDAELDGHPIRVGEEVVMLGRAVDAVPVAPDWADSDENPMGAWFRHYAAGRPNLRAPEVMQLLWCDDSGRFPGEVGCDPVVERSQPWAEALASPAWSEPPEPRLRAELIRSAQRRRFV